jgi:hypothetical protein
MTGRIEAFEILKKFQNSATSDWWTIDNARQALCDQFDGGRENITNRMVSDFLKDIGIADRHTRTVLFECLNFASIRRAISLWDQRDYVRGLREEQSIIDKAEDDLDEHLAVHRSVFYLAEFNLGLAAEHPPWPRIIVSVTSGLACAATEAKKSIYYRLNRLGSHAPGTFMPSWAGRGRVNIFTNSRRIRGWNLPKRNRLTYLEEADYILRYVADQRGKTASLPFTLGWRD